MATIVISLALALTRTPVSTGRMSSREAARATTLDRLGQRRRRDRQRLLALGSGKLGEVLGGEGAQVEARAAAADLDVALGLAQLELDRLVAERAGELGEQAAGQQDRAGALGLGLERRLQAHLEVGRRAGSPGRPRRR